MAESLPSDVSRYAASVEYDGADYHGWQRQRASISVQQVVEAALSNIANEPVSVFCAGRTDSGVHASSQIVHFDSRASRSDVQWLRGVNTQLPDDVSIPWVSPVSGHFHARFSALSRRYRYIIYNRKVSPGILRRAVTWHRSYLDADSMHIAVQSLLGEHDFSSFRASGCNAHTPFRCIQAARVVRIDDYVVLDITANAFLQHMVRNIVGLLLKIGSNEWSVSSMKEILEMRDRRQSAPTASPCGLYLVAVEYPQTFNLPETLLGPAFIGSLLP